MTVFCSRAESSFAPYKNAASPVRECNYFPWVRRTDANYYSLPVSAFVGEWVALAKRLAVLSAEHVDWMDLQSKTQDSLQSYQRFSYALQLAPCMQSVLFTSRRHRNLRAGAEPRGLQYANDDVCAGLSHRRRGFGTSLSRRSLFPCIDWLHMCSVRLIRTVHV